jgi:tRNA nucleotidyltransferase (CCA-adding enzyme)
MQVVTTHKNTDFDGLASTIAATILYPEAIPVLPRQINPNAKGFLSIHKDILKTCLSDDVLLEDVKRLIVVDINKWDRLGRIGRLKKNKDLEIFLWDHHSDDGDIKPTWKCKERVCERIQRQF